MLYEKELQKINQSIDLKKWSKEKVINYTSNEKALIVYLTVGLIKQILLYIMSYIKTK